MYCSLYRLDRTWTFPFATGSWTSPAIQPPESSCSSGFQEYVLRSWFIWLHCKVHKVCWWYHSAGSYQQQWQVIIQERSGAGCRVVQRTEYLSFCYLMLPKWKRWLQTSGEPLVIILHCTSVAQLGRKSNTPSFLVCISLVYHQQPCQETPAVTFLFPSSLLFFRWTVEHISWFKSLDCLIWELQHLRPQNSRLWGQLSRSHVLLYPSSIASTPTSQPALWPFPPLSWKLHSSVCPASTTEWCNNLFH